MSHSNGSKDSKQKGGTKNVEMMINDEEKFREVDVSKLSQGAFLIEDSPDEALKKLLCLGTSSELEILGYAKHLGEIADLVGRELVPHLPSILGPMVISCSKPLTIIGQS